MYRILFVDDEKRILQGLRRILHRKRKEWEMLYVESGADALAAMAEEPFDVVVSDMRMPGMDGAALLSRVQEEYPATVRIVLSGHADIETVMRAIPSTHQYLSKPCNERLEQVVESVCAMLELIPDRELRRAIGALGPMPACPPVLQEFSEALEQPDVSLPRLADIARQDLAISTEILRLANSGFFDAAKATSSIKEAISYLGVDVLRSLAESIPIFDERHTGQRFAGMLSGGETHHAKRVAEMASSLVDGERESEIAFTGAMLHDVGELILAQCVPDQFDAMLQEMSQSGRPRLELEEEIIGVTHACAGRFLLGLWGVPAAIVDVIAHHHDPEAAEDAGLGIVGAVHVADALLAEAANSGGPRPVLDLDYLDRRQLSDQLPNWRQMAKDLAVKLPKEAPSHALLDG